MSLLLASPRDASRPSRSSTAVVRSAVWPRGPSCSLPAIVEAREVTCLSAPRGRQASRPTEDRQCFNVLHL